MLLFTLHYIPENIFAGSITDKQINEQNNPITKDDIKNDEIDDIDTKPKRKLKRIRKKRNWKRRKLRRTR